MEFDPTIDHEYEAEAANAANYGEFVEQTERRHCGCEQLLTELNHIRAVEIPHLESEVQNALYQMMLLMNYCKEHGFAVDSYIMQQCNELLEKRYTEPVIPSAYPNELPF